MNERDTLSSKGIFLLFISLFVCASQVLSQQTFKIVDQTENYIRISAHFSLPDTKSVIIENKLYSDISTPDGLCFIQDNKYQLPFRSELIHLAGKKAGVVVLSSKEYRLPVNPPKPYSLDEATGRDPENPFLVNRNADLLSRNSTTLVELHYKGAYRGNYLWSIDIFPYTFDNRTD